MSQETVSYFLSSPFSFIFLSFYFPCWNWKTKLFFIIWHLQNSVLKKMVLNELRIGLKAISGTCPGEITGEFMTVHLIYCSVCFNYWLVCFLLHAYASKTSWDFLIFTLALIAVLIFLAAFCLYSLKNCPASSAKMLQKNVFIAEQLFVCTHLADRAIG